MAGLPMLLLGVLLELCSGVSVNRGGYPTFTDEIPFKITWPGAEFTLVSCPLEQTMLFFWASCFSSVYFMQRANIVAF